MLQVATKLYTILQSKIYQMIQQACIVKLGKNLPFYSAFQLPQLILKLLLDCWNEEHFSQMGLVEESRDAEPMVCSAP